MNNVIKHGNIRLGNKRALSDFKPREGEVVYDIDRPNILGNPYPIESPMAIHRDESIEKYHTLLFEQMKNHNTDMFKEIAKIACWLREGKNVILMCWCHPLACHGDVVIEAVKALNIAWAGDCAAPIADAPQWLKDRMTALSKLPPPSPEKMRTQFRASAFWTGEINKFDAWWDKVLTGEFTITERQRLHTIAHDAWMAGANDKFQMMESLQWYAGHLRPEDRVNDNGDKAETVLKELGYEKRSQIQEAPGTPAEG
jgi:hypothetical protein